MGKKEEPGRDIGKLEGDVSKFLPSLASLVSSPRWAFPLSSSPSSSVASSAALSSSPLPSSATRPSDISSSSLDLFFNYCIIFLGIGRRFLRLTILPLERWVLFADGVACLPMLSSFDCVLHSCLPSSSFLRTNNWY